MNDNLVKQKIVKYEKNISFIYLFQVNTLDYFKFFKKD